MENIKTGFLSMKDLYPSYKHHHIPLWLKKAIRVAAIKNGTWIKGCHCESFFLNNRTYSGLFDHWASVQIGDVWNFIKPELFGLIPASIICSNERAIITQPYGKMDKLAENFSKDHACALKTIRPGTWHPNTSMYIFLKIDSEIFKPNE
jgi:hypothetical protein